MNFTPADQNNFDRIFSDVVPKSNQERLDDYLAARRDTGLRQPWILEYEAKGETRFTCGGTAQEALKLTNEKEPDGWVFNNIMTQQEWYEGLKQCTKT